LAKPNYRHQKKQKELARKTRHAEKQKKRLTREDGSPQDATADDAAPIANILDPTASNPTAPVAKP